MAYFLIYNHKVACTEDVEMPRKDLKVGRYKDVEIIKTKSRLLLTLHLLPARQEVASLKQALICCLQMGCQLVPQIRENIPFHQGVVNFRHTHASTVLPGPQFQSAMQG